MTRARDPNQTPWFRRHDVDAQHALRQAGVLPWLAPLEGAALDDYRLGRWIDLRIWMNLGAEPAPGEEIRIRMQQDYADWLRITLRQVK